MFGFSQNLGNPNFGFSSESKVRTLAESSFSDSFGISLSVSNSPLVYSLVCFAFFCFDWVLLLDSFGREIGILGKAAAIAH